MRSSSRERCQYKDTSSRARIESSKIIGDDDCVQRTHKRTMCQESRFIVVNNGDRVEDITLHQSHKHEGTNDSEGIGNACWRLADGRIEGNFLATMDHNSPIVILVRIETLNRSMVKVQTEVLSLEKYGREGYEGYGVNDNAYMMEEELRERHRDQQRSLHQKKRWELNWMRLKAKINMERKGKPSECSAWKCQNCNVKHDGMINAINALTASVKEMIFKKGIIPSNKISYPYTLLEIKEAKRRRKDISKVSSSIEKRKITMPLSLSCIVVQCTRATGEQHELKKYVNLDNFQAYLQLADSVFNLVIGIFKVNVLMRTQAVVPTVEQITFLSVIQCILFYQPSKDSLSNPLKVETECLISGPRVTNDLVVHQFPDGLSLRTSRRGRTFQFWHSSNGRLGRPSGDLIDHQIDRHRPRSANFSFFKKAFWSFLPHKTHELIFIKVDFLTRSELSLGGVFSTEREMWYFSKTTCHRRIDIDDCGPKAEYGIVIEKLRLIAVDQIGTTKKGPSLLFHSTTTLLDMADPNSYKKIYIESFRELQRKCDELRRDLADFRERLRRVLLLPDENYPSDNKTNMTNPVWDVAILRNAVWELQTQVHDLQWELTVVRGVKMLRMITVRPGPSGFVSASTADGSNLTAIVTGASGIGLETARVLAMNVIIAAGNMEAANEAKQYILKDNKDARIDIEKLDLSKIRSVEAFADSFKALNLPFSILINNAGVMFCPFQLSEDGIEMQFTTNHIGHFYLTNLLIDKMKETAKSTGIQGRIVNVPSLVYQVTYKGGIQLDKINDKNSHRDERAYGQSKLTNFLHSNELSRRLQLQRLDKLYAVPEKLNLERNAIHTYENCYRNVLFELSFTTSA
ncbi:hypothetical protein FXO38_08759 [Capsicum annuum]|nr:hypothetical protein FXO38_08759 [Capsicum annuum]